MKQICAQVDKIFTIHVYGAQKGVPNIIDCVSISRLCRNFLEVPKKNLTLNLFLFQVVTINEKQKLKDLPPVEGLLSYSKDVKKLYLSNGQKWNGIITDDQVTKIVMKSSFVFTS